MNNPPIAWSSMVSKDHSLYVGGLLGDQPLLFDLRKDPTETRNIYDPSHEAVGRLSQAYFKFLAEELHASDKIIERLKSYLTAQTKRVL